MLNRTFILGTQKVMFHLSWVLLLLMMGSLVFGGNVGRLLVLHGAFAVWMFAEVALMVGLAKDMANTYLHPPHKGASSGAPGFLMAAFLLMLALPISAFGPGASPDVNSILLIPLVALIVPWVLGTVWGYALKRRYRPAWAEAHKAYWLAHVQKLIDSLDETLVQKGQRLQKTAGMDGNQLQRYYLHLYRARQAGVI